MREEDVRSENERYYYFKNYVWGIKKWSFIISLVCVFLMTFLSINISRLLLKRRLLDEAATHGLKYVDVMDWVNEGLKGWWMRPVSILIIIFNVAIAIIIFLNFYGFKSYKVYKNKWIRKIPVVLYLLEFLCICREYDIISLPIVFIILVFNLSPIIFASRLLYPLESRPGAEGLNKVFSFLFDVCAQIIINQL